MGAPDFQSASNLCTFSAALFSSADLWQVVKPTVRQVQHPDGVLIIDDSIEEKPYTDESELICWHFDHSKDRTVKGINFLSTLYIVGRRCWQRDLGNCGAGTLPSSKGQPPGPPTTTALGDNISKVGRENRY